MYNCVSPQYLGPGLRAHVDMGAYLPEDFFQLVHNRGKTLGKAKTPHFRPTVKRLQIYGRMRESPPYMDNPFLRQHT